jgi:hypothetical protein
MSQIQETPREMTVKDAAEFYNRSVRTIRLWCANGTLLSARCRVIRDVTGRWKIIQPDEN